MNLVKLVRILTRHHFEYSCKCDENGEYYINIILGNREYLVNAQDENGIEELWNDLKTYWLYN
jgi:hypothetical protein